MNAQIVKAFQQSLVKVLETMAFTPAQAGKPYAAESKDLIPSDVTGIIGLTGDRDGSLSIAFSAPCILGLVGSMFGETMTEVNDEVLDAVGELTNIVCGDARRVLDDQGLHLAGAIPTVVSGTAHTVAPGADGRRLILPFETDFGPLRLEVFL